MKGLTIQERRVLVAILLALAIGALVRHWRKQGDGGILNIEQEVKNVEGMKTR